MRHTTSILRLLSAATLGVALLGGVAQASELRYTPINPSFGGNPFNTYHLMGVANGINKFEDPKSSSAATALNPNDEFARTIRSSVLSRVSSEIANQIYGEKALDHGTVSIDGLNLNWKSVNGQTVLIMDNGNGGTTTINIPKYAP